MNSIRRYLAEFIGTALLVFFGVGSAVAGFHTGGVVVVSLAFGFILLALVYTFGPVSGCHVNPAITFGALLSRRTPLPEAIAYWIAQFAGGILAGFALYVLTRWGGVTDETGTLGTDGYGKHINLGGAALVEIVLTFILVLTVLVVTSRTENAGFAGLAIGIVLAACHLVAVPLDGTGVNPARALGPAIFEGGKALSHLWAFIVFPLIGGLIAAAVLPLTHGGRIWRRGGEQDIPPRTPSDG